MKLNKVTLILAMAAGTQLAGCMGQMGLSKALTEVNLTAVDNRYARAGLYMLLSPVYGFTATADLFVFNSIEFWTGKNPITNQSPAVVDMPANAILKVNDKLGKDLSKAPLKVSNDKIEDAQFIAIDDNTLQLLVRFENGDEQNMIGKRNGDMVDFSVNGNFVTSVSIDEMNAYAANR